MGATEREWVRAKQEPNFHYLCVAFIVIFYLFFWSIWFPHFFLIVVFILHKLLSLIKCLVCDSLLDQQFRFVYEMELNNIRQKKKKMHIRIECEKKSDRAKDREIERPEMIYIHFLFVHDADDLVFFFFLEFICKIKMKLSFIVPCATVIIDHLNGVRMDGKFLNSRFLANCFGSIFLFIRFPTSVQTSLLLQSVSWIT